MAKITKAQIETKALELIALNAQIKLLSAEADALKSFFKDNGSFLGKTVAVTVSQSSRQTIKSDLIRERYPEIALECTVSTDVLTVSAKKLK